MSVKALETHLKPLKPFLEMAGVTEICINQPQEVYVEKNGFFTHHEIPALGYEHLEALAELVAEFNHQIISPEKPLLSGVLLNGERAQFVISPACENGKVICAIRCHHMKNLTLADYEQSGAFEALKPAPVKKNLWDEPLVRLYRDGNFKAFIETAIKARKNILISGGTGTGKTTFLNATLKIISDTERLITLEDTREVQLKQPNVVHLLASKGQQGVAKIRMLDLFEGCLRLRPDRIFLSELRAEEAFAFLRAANSGHPGSVSTVHADTPQGCFDQMVFMMQQAGSTSRDERILAYIKSIIPIVIQLKRCQTEERFMTVSEIYFNAQA